MINYKRWCIICEKELVCRRNNAPKGKGRGAESKDGILFYFNESFGHWFCNNCWSKIEGYIKKFKGKESVRMRYHKYKEVQCENG